MEWNERCEKFSVLKHIIVTLNDSASMQQHNLINSLLANEGIQSLTGDFSEKRKLLCYNHILYMASYLS